MVYMYAVVLFPTLDIFECSILFEKHYIRLYIYIYKTLARKSRKAGEKSLFVGSWGGYSDIKQIISLSIYH